MANTTKELTILDAAKKIFEEAAFTIDDQNVKEEMIMDIAESISNYIDKKILQRLTDKQKAMFDQLIAVDPSDEDIKEFITTHVDDVSLIVKDAILDVRNTYLQGRVQ